VFKRFVDDVVSELKKADHNDTKIQEAHEEFLRFYNQDMVRHFITLQQQAQTVKDRYYLLLKKAATEMTNEFRILSGKVDDAMIQLDDYPAVLNEQNRKKLNDLNQYCSARIIKEPVLEYTITCNNCGFSLADILNYTALAPNKENELLVIKNSFKAEDLNPDTPNTANTPRKIKLSVKSQKMTVGEYRKVLSGHLQTLAGMNDSDEIELDIDT